MNLVSQREFFHVISCRDCSRLVKYQARLKDQHPDYWCAPVPPWGSMRPRLMVVGLAPGLGGAGRTGRGFVGDASGAFLFDSLHRFGFASHQLPELARLRATVITNIVKCTPPANRPVSQEKRNCEKFLRKELMGFAPSGRARNRVILCLGRDAYEALNRLLELPTKPFAHGLHVQAQKNLFLLTSFHPSRLNVNTKRLTRDMLDAVLGNAKSLLSA